MRIDRRGRETVYWDLTDSPPGDIEVTFDGVTWHPTVRVDTAVTALIAGPDSTGNPEGTVVLGIGRHFALLRTTAAPELLVRSAGTIDVVTHQPPPV